MYRIITMNLVCDTHQLCMCRVEKQGLPSFPLPITGRETLQLTSFMPEPAISLHLFHRFFTTFKSNFPLYCMSMSADELWYWRNSDGTCEADSASLVEEIV